MACMYRDHTLGTYDKDMIILARGGRQPGWWHKSRSHGGWPLAWMSQNKASKQISINRKWIIDFRIWRGYLLLYFQLSRCILPSEEAFPPPWAALLVETSTSTMSLTSNSAPANGPVCRCSGALGEQGERPNGPSVENMAQSVKSPVPPAVVTIMEHQRHKWPFSGFYSLAIHSISIVGILELPNASKTHFCCSFLGHYIFSPTLYVFLKAVCTQGYYVTLMRKRTSFSCSLSSLILPHHITQIEKSSYLYLSL